MRALLKNLLNLLKFGRLDSVKNDLLKNERAITNQTNRTSFRRGIGLRVSAYLQDKLN